VCLCFCVCVMVCVFVFLCERRHGGAQLALYSYGAEGGSLHQVASVTQLDRQVCEGSKAHHVGVTYIEQSESRINECE
jgi:hypothetical protein